MGSHVKVTNAAKFALNNRRLKEKVCYLKARTFVLHAMKYMMQQILEQGKIVANPVLQKVQDYTNWTTVTSLPRIKNVTVKITLRKYAR